jgi:hypothetical protein
MPKQFLVLGISSGAIAAIVSCFFAYFFNHNLFDFSSVLPYWKIISVNFSLALMAAGVFYGLNLVSRKYCRTIFNCLFALCSILSVIFPITAKFEDLEFPEFYPTFAIPLHLFFSVIFLSFSSILIKDEK